MTNKFPKSFYFKLSFIILLVLFGYFQNQNFIQATLNDESFNVNESFNLIMREVMKLPNNVENDEVISEYISGYAQPGNQVPYQIHEKILSDDNYAIAKQSANQFNAALDNRALNDAFLRQMNHMRGTKGWEQIQFGEHLEEGVLRRVEEMGEYHYLSSITADGADFRAQFPSVSDAEYRLGENLYELYISAGDVHLTTWENEKILADYLFDVYADAVSLSNYDIYQSQYISIYAAPTDYSVDEVPYVRLVVSLVFDTEGGI